jgi:hypothetical protein
MTTPERLAVGDRRHWRVKAHAPFGVFVEAVDSHTGWVGLIDLVQMPENVRGGSEDDFPPLGTVLEAVVVGYSPSEQLRLSLLETAG